MALLKLILAEGAKFLSPILSLGWLLASPALLGLIVYLLILRRLKIFAPPPLSTPPRGKIPQMLARIASFPPTHLVGRRAALFAHLALTFHLIAPQSPVPYAQRILSVVLKAAVIGLACHVQRLKLAALVQLNVCAPQAHIIHLRLGVYPALEAALAPLRVSKPPHALGYVRKGIFVLLAQKIRHHISAPLESLGQHLALPIHRAVDCAVLATMVWRGVLPLTAVDCVKRGTTALQGLQRQHKICALLDILGLQLASQTHLAVGCVKRDMSACKVLHLRHNILVV